MMRYAVALALGAALAASAAQAAYPGRLDPDWPCQQIKVAHLSPGAMWAGPALDPYARTWSQNAEVAALVPRLAERRVPIEQAQADITAFARRAGSAKQQQLTMLMAGLFDTLGQERDSVLDGLDRFGQRQRAFAAELRADNEALHTLQADSNAAPEKVQQAVDQLTMELRVFEDRRQSLRFACDVPTQIEQRLYALAQAIQQAIQQAMQ